MLSFVANLMSADVQPAAWAKAREAEGWPVLGASDHFWSDGRPFPHLWVALATMAAATDGVLLTSSFANNIVRSPVEFAQAALGMQQVSGGRFEAGLGAGWSRDEILGAGLAYPDPPERAGRYAEAVQIVRQLFHEGSCRFSGRHYAIDVPVIGPRQIPPPPIVASVGGSRTIREVTPHVDRVELKANASATRGGALDLEVAGQISKQHLHDLVSAVRRVREDVPLGLFVLCSVGEDRLTKYMRSKCDPHGLFADFYGPAEQVAEAVRKLEGYGLDRVQLSPFDDGAFEQLAPLLLA